MLLTEIAANGAWRAPTSLGKAPEPGDNHIWDLLLMDENAVLITGDRLLLNHPPARRSVITPADYITAFAH